MTFDTYFRVSSYAMVASSTLALAISGGVSVISAAVFFILLVAAWFCEGGRRWQLSSRAGLIVLLLALPLFYFNWKLRLFSGFSASPEIAGLNSLIYFILFLALLKVWQVKADRDWLFLHLISFFEILLAAGLSVSPSFLLLLGLYVLCAISTVICFEIVRARRGVAMESRLAVFLEPTRLRRLLGGRSRHRQDFAEVSRLPLVACGLVLLIFCLALPIFFIAPRFRGSALTRASGGTTGLVGFSDEVTIGEIAKLERSNRLVMRVRVDDPQLARQRDLRWRGVALDQFDGRTWRRSDPQRKVETPNERGLFQFGTTTALDRLTIQSFFIEPVDTPVLFAAPRAVAIQGQLPFVERDREGGIVSRDHSQERIAYRAYSDTTEPAVEELRADLGPDPAAMARYLELPDHLDQRVRNLTRWVIVDGRAGNRHDAARAVEAYLRREFQYSLDLKAGGGDPLSDFLFRVRAGNCEYFATAMAVMLRTAEVPTRVVNGFQTGEYNPAADAFTVRQADAHSWVEVYFPETDSWVTFDPTPAAARTNGDGAQGLTGRLQQYAEAFELFWIQYVVAYDKQEQRSLANLFREQLGVYRLTAAQAFAEVRASLIAAWHGLTEAAGGPATRPALGLKLLWVALALVAAGVFLGYFFLRGKSGKLWRRRDQVLSQKKFETAVKFYGRMTKALAGRGLSRAADQTPLEFAATSGIPEALLVTRAYNRVRFGDQHLSPADAARIEEWLRKIEGENKSQT